jgi:hypothetical protein
LFFTAKRALSIFTGPVVAWLVAGIGARRFGHEGFGALLHFERHGSAAAFRNYFPLADLFFIPAFFAFVCFFVHVYSLRNPLILQPLAQKNNPFR